MADQIQNSEPPNGSPTRLDRADARSFAITSSLALAVYLFTLAQEVTLTWSGVMSTSAMYGGVAPPPGYPLWTIYSWLFIKLLPFSNIAWRVAAGSAAAGAVACGLLGLIISHAGRMIFHQTVSFDRFTLREQNLIRIVCGCVPGLALAFSGGFWYEAVNQEYWTLPALLFVIVVYLFMRWLETGARGFCWLMFFVCGLLLTGNQELILLLPGLVGAVILADAALGRDVAIIILPLGAAVNLWSGFPTLAGSWWFRPILDSFAAIFLSAIVLAAVTRRIATRWKSALACALFFLLGLSVYFYVPIASMTNPPVNWAYARTIEGFLHTVSRGQYELANPTAQFSRFAGQLWGLSKEISSEFGWLYLIFAALPFCFLWRMTATGRKWLLSLLPMFACVGPLLLALLNPEFGMQSNDVIFEGYFFPLRVLIALCSGIGLMIAAMAASKPTPFRQLPSAVR